MLGYAELDGDAPLFASTRRRKLLWPAVALALGIVGCVFVWAGQAWNAASAIPSEVGEAPDAAADASATTSPAAADLMRQQRFVGLTKAPTGTSIATGPAAAKRVQQRLGGLTEAIEISFAVDMIRESAVKIIGSLSPEHLKQVYYPDADAQTRQWQICTIVQQCLVPDFGLAMGNLSAHTREHVYELLALSLSGESYKLTLVQTMSNLLLGEMQNWAINCPGTCHKLIDESGLLPKKILIDNPHVSEPTDLSFADCKKAAAAGATAGKVMHLWNCNEQPRMVHHANMDTATGRYFLGNVFAEPTIHARNNFFDFFSIYGSLKPGEPFGFRYSGHHFDLSFRFGADGAVSDLPVFLGHNPLMVPRQSPPLSANHEDYLNWHNMAGVGQFPDIVFVILEAAKALRPESFVSLQLWDSTPSSGGLTLKDGKSMSDVNHLDLSSIDEAEFEAVWALIEYTLEFARGDRPKDDVKADFRSGGLMSWTTTGEGHLEEGLEHTQLPLTVADLVATRSFFYVRAETPTLLFFVMVNQLFTLVDDKEPSNHLHSILIPKSFLAHPNGYGPGVTCSLPGVDCTSGTALPAADAIAKWQLTPAVPK